MKFPSCIYACVIGSCLLLSACSDDTIETKDSAAEPETVQSIQTEAEAKVTTSTPDVIQTLTGSDFFPGDEEACCGTGCTKACE